MPTSKIGICHICGEYGPLSFEHVPPEKAWNETRALIFSGNDLLLRKAGRNPKGRIQQRGFGRYTLCEQCNSNTGSWYAPELIEWTKWGFSLLGKISTSVAFVRVELSNVRPMNFLKQVVTMMMSAVSSDFGLKNPDIVKFLMNKRQMHLPIQIDIYLSLYRGLSCGTVGLAGVFNPSDPKPGKIVSQITYPPFAYLMILDSPFESYPGKISYFGRYEYDEKASIQLELPVFDKEPMVPITELMKPRHSIR